MYVERVVMCLPLSRLGFFLSSGLGRDLPAANTSKTVWCTAMKFSQVDGMVKLNIRYTFVVMATNSDVIILIGFEAVQLIFFQDYFFLFCQRTYVITSINRFILIDVLVFIILAVLSNKTNFIFAS